MILDFDFQQVMRLSNVKRWGIVEMSREQSVAEHSYNVIMITGALCEYISMDDEWAAMAMKWASMHDLPEIVTGDIPTPVKLANPEAFKQIDEGLFPKYANFKDDISGHGIKALVKVADDVEAIQFFNRFCIDSRKYNILGCMGIRLANNIEKIEYLSEHSIASKVSSWLK